MKTLIRRDVFQQMKPQNEDLELPVLELWRSLESCGRLSIGLRPVSVIEGLVAIAIFSHLLLPAPFPAK
jgi:hypothetical protein